MNKRINFKTRFLDVIKFIPKSIYTKSGNKIYPLKIIKQNKRVLIANTKDRHNGRYTKRYIKIPKNKLCLIYSWPAGKNQYKGNLGRRYQYSLIPKYLPLDKLTLNSLGLLQAEMTKHTKRASNIIFTNSEPSLNNLILDFFKRFSIYYGDWSWHIVFNFKLKRIESIDETDNREKLSELFWIKNTKIESDNKTDKFIQYTGNRIYSNMDKDTCLLGTLIISKSNIIIYQFMLNLLKNIKKVICNKKEIIYYLQGLFAGDGDIKLTKTGSIDSVRIGCMNLNEKRLYRTLFNKLGIKSHIEENCVCVNNRYNFVKIFKNKLVYLHPKRSQKFMNGMLKFRYIPEDLRLFFSTLTDKFNNPTSDSNFTSKEVTNVKYSLV